MKKLAALLLVSFALAGPASSQVRAQAGPMERRDEPVHVQVATSFFVAGSTDEGEEANKLREDARRKVYIMAAHECDLLKATIASDCRLENISVNINRQQGYQQKDGFMVNGNIGFKISPK